MRKTAQELAKHYDDLFAQGKELEGLVPVAMKVSPNPDTIYSTRYSRDEIALIRQAAKKQSITASAFIRTAALAAAAGQLNLAAGEKAAKLGKVRKQARELAEAVEAL